MSKGDEIAKRYADPDFYIACVAAVDNAIAEAVGERDRQIKEFNRALAAKCIPEFGKTTKEEAFMSAMQTFSRYFYETRAPLEAVDIAKACENRSVEYRRGFEDCLRKLTK